MADLKNIEEKLDRIAAALEALAQSGAPQEPNWRYPLAAYAQFDWASIGARVVQRDDYGVSAVSWNGHMWTRRSGAGKYGKAIWFSRPAGQDEDGTNYLRLVTFKDLSPAEALPESVAGELKHAPQDEPVRAQTSRPEPETERQTKNGRVQLDKDWELEAATSTEPLMFDTAVLKAWPWYRDVTAVTTFRETLFGKWKAGKAPAYTAGMREYVQQRQAGRVHEKAKIEALNVYHTELERARAGGGS